MWNADIWKDLEKKLGVGKDYVPLIIFSDGLPKG